MRGQEVLSRSLAIDRQRKSTFNNCGILGFRINFPKPSIRLNPSSEKSFRFPFAGLNLTTVDANIQMTDQHLMNRGLHPSSSIFRNECASDSTAL
jgi:hypothetical protein